MAAAYRKAALEHHPDKKGAATADEETKRAIEQHFTLIQDAYETLSDPAKRREYDSVDDFDDTLPYECQPADFFKVCVCTSWSGIHESVQPSDRLGCMVEGIVFRICKHNHTLGSLPHSQCHRFSGAANPFNVWSLMPLLRLARDIP